VDQPKNQSTQWSLSQGEKERLLQIAKSAIEEKVRGIEVRPAEVSSGRLQEELGVFVTIHKLGSLRGCIGYVQGMKPLHQAVQEMALAAAFGDPRFPPVEAQELGDLEVEISVLSPLQRIQDVSEIQVGTHGILIQHGSFSGLLLPQVATQYGWDRTTFLQQTCLKAGLNPEAWSDSQAEIFVFSADIFGE